MQDAAIEKLADEKAHAASRMEMVHIGEAVRIDTRQKRHYIRNLGNIVPCQLDTGGSRHGDQMDGVVGRAAGRIEADDAIDEGALVQHFADRRIFIATGGDGQRTLGGFAGQGIAQRRARIDEGCARQMQAHDFHQHLVGIGRAVESAGSGAVIGFRFRFQQFGAPDLAFGIKLAGLGLLVIRQAAGHRPGRHEHGGKVPEGERANDEAGHDLVADTEINGCIEHIVRQAHSRRHRNDFAGEQRQFHARDPLRNAIAHGWHAARNLCDAACFTRRLLDELREGLEWLMRRQHVVIGSDDAEVRYFVAGQRRLVMRPAGSKTMREVGTAQNGALRPVGRGFPHTAKIGFARRLGPFANARGDFLNAFVSGLHGHGYTCANLA